MAKGLFRNNLGLKVFSVLLAVMLEYYFYSPDNSESGTFSASVVFRNLPKNWMIVRPLNAEDGLFAKFRVRGPSTTVKELELTEHRIFVDLPIPPVENFTAILKRAHLQHPPGVKVLEINPPSIDLKLEKVVRKELLVIVDQIGEVAPGYAITEMKVLPETVLARGPKSELDGLGIVETQPVAVNGLTKSKRFEVALVNKGPMTRLGVDVVAIEVDVQSVMTQRSFQGVNVTVLAPKAYAATVQPSNVSLVLQGPLKVLENMEAKDIELIADGQNLKAGSYKVELTANFQKGVTMIGTKPKKVTINMVSTNG